MELPWTQRLLLRGLYNVSDDPEQFFAGRIGHITVAERDKIKSDFKLAGIKKGQVSQAMPFAMLNLYGDRLAKLPQDLRNNLILGGSVTPGDLSNAQSESKTRSSQSGKYIDAIGNRSDFAWTSVPDKPLIVSVFDDIREKIWNYSTKFYARNPELASMLELVSYAGATATMPASNFPAKALFGQTAPEVIQGFQTGVQREQGAVGAPTERESKTIPTLGTAIGMGIQLYAGMKSGFLPWLNQGSFALRVLKTSSFNIALGTTARASIEPALDYVFRLRPEESKGIFTDIKQREWEGALDWLNTFTFDLAFSGLEMGVIGLDVATMPARQARYAAGATRTAKRQLFMESVIKAEDRPFEQARIAREFARGNDHMFGGAKLPWHVRKWYQTWEPIIEKYEYGFGVKTGWKALGLEADKEIPFLYEGVIGNRIEDTLRKPLVEAYDSLRWANADADYKVGLLTKQVKHLTEGYMPSKVDLPDGTVLRHGDVKKYFDEQLTLYLSRPESSNLELRQRINPIFGEREITYTTSMGDKRTVKVVDRIADLANGMRAKQSLNQIKATETTLVESVLGAVNDVKLVDESTFARYPKYLRNIYGVDEDTLSAIRQFGRRDKSGRIAGVQVDLKHHNFKRDKYGIFAKPYPKARNYEIIHTFDDTEAGRIQYDEALARLRGESEDVYSSYPQSVYDWEVSHTLEKPHDKINFFRNGWKTVKGYAKQAKNTARTRAVDRILEPMDDEINAALGKAKIVRGTGALGKTGITQQEFRKRGGVVYEDYAVYTDPLGESEGYVIQHVPTGDILATGVQSQKTAKRVLYELQRSGGVEYVNGILTEDSRGNIDMARVIIDELYATAPYDPDEAARLFREFVDKGRISNESVDVLLTERPEYLEHALSGKKFAMSDFEFAEPPEFVLLNEIGENVSISMDLNKQWWNHLPSDSKITVRYRQPKVITTNEGIKKLDYELAEGAPSEVVYLEREFDSVAEARRFIKSQNKLLVDSMEIQSVKPLTAAERQNLKEVTDPIQRFEEGYFNASRDVHVANMMMEPASLLPEVFSGTESPSLDDIARVFGISDNVTADYQAAEQIWNNAKSLSKNDPARKQAFSRYRDAKRNYDLAGQIEYRKLPEVEVNPDTGEILWTDKTRKALAFGKMQGKYVPKAWAEDFESITGVTIDDLSRIAKFRDVVENLITRRFKKNKVIWSGSAHTNQFMTNPLYSFISGNWIADSNNWKWYQQSAKEWATTGERYREALSMRVLEDMASAEMGYRQGQTTQPFIDIAQRLKGKKQSQNTWAKVIGEHLPDNYTGKNALDIAMNVIETISKTAGDGEAILAAAYQFNDNYYKLATYLKATAPVAEGGWGMSKELAREHIFKFHPNYSRFSHWLRAARKTPLVNPFISFRVEDSRIRLNGMKEHPFRTMAAFVLFPKLTSVASGIAAGLTYDRIAELNENKPPWRKRNDFASIIIPGQDGSFHNFNYSNWLAGNDVFDFYEDPTDAPMERIVRNPAFSSIFNSALYAPMLGMMQNRDPFSQREIWSKGVSPGYNVGETARYIHDSFGPAILSTYKYLQMGEALSDKTIKKQKPIDVDGEEYPGWNVKREKIPTILKNTLGVRYEHIEPLKEALVRYNSLGFTASEFQTQLKRMEDRGESGSWEYEDAEWWNYGNKQASVKFQQVMKSRNRILKEQQKMADKIYELEYQGYTILDEGVE